MSDRPVPTQTVAAALERAHSDARTAPANLAPADGVVRTRRVAMGDPQAPLDRVLGILDRHGLLGADGRLIPAVHFTSMGDHFDWGQPHQRDVAARDGLTLLAWLAAHPADQVTILAGNHDLGRVGELIAFDDARFAAAQRAADAIYRNREADPEDDRAFARAHGAPSAEFIARDFGSFREAQRTLIAALLRGRRLRIASSPAPDLLLTHAGVTEDELEAVGASSQARSDAPAIADLLNAHLDAAVDAWTAAGARQPLGLDLLHAPGIPGEEGRGMLYHRPARPADGDAPRRDPLFAGPPRRRFDPRRLPLGLVQAIGHIGDKKCRDLLGDWAQGDPAQGRLRHLRADGRGVAYAVDVPVTSAPDAATMLFLDGEMWNDAHESRYALLDVDRRAAAVR